MISPFTRQLYGKLEAPVPQEHPNDLLLLLEDKSSVVGRAPLGAFPLGETGYVRTYVQWGEQTQLLFFLPDADYFELFLLLVKCDKVGPTKAVQILGKHKPETIRNAGSPEELTKLVGACGHELFKLLPKAEKKTTPVSKDRETAIAALVGLGIKPTEARARVDKALESCGTAPVDQLIKTALQNK